MDYLFHEMTIQGGYIVKNPDKKVSNLADFREKYRATHRYKYSRYNPKFIDDLEKIIDNYPVDKEKLKAEMIRVGIIKAPANDIND